VKIITIEYASYKLEKRHLRLAKLLTNSIIIDIIQINYY